MQGNIKSVAYAKAYASYKYNTNNYKAKNQFISCIDNWVQKRKLFKLKKKCGMQLGELWFEFDLNSNDCFII